MDLTDLFRALGVIGYDAALPEGRIAWRDEHRVVVARARCEVILSHASADDSVVYGAEHVQLAAAGVPTLPLDAVPDELRPPGPMSEPDARRVAAGLASRRGAPFIYRCRFGMVSLFVAVFDLDIFPAPDEPSTALERDALARYVGFVLRATSAALRAQPTSESADLGLRQLERVLAEHRDQLGLDDADRVRAVIRGLLAKRDAAAASALDVEAGRWPEPVLRAAPDDIEPIPPFSPG